MQGKSGGIIDKKQNQLINLFIATIIGTTSGLSFTLLVMTYTVYLNAHHVSLELLGLLSLRTLPYALKFIWAPMIDRIHLPIFPKNFGQRKSWILVTQLCLIVSIFSMGYIDVEKHVYLACFFALVVSFFGASHDIAMDGFRIEFAAARHATMTNSFVILGFRIGFLISGALALYLSTVIEWQYIFMIIALSIIPAMFVVYYVKEDRVHEHSPSHNRHAWFRDFVLNPLRGLVKMPKFSLIICIIAFYKVSDGYLSNLLVPFLLKSGFTMVNISLVTETFGLSCYVAGTFFGGMVLRTMHPLRNLFLAEIMAAITNLIFILVAQNHGNIYIYVFATCFESLCAGIANISVINYMSMICTNQKYTATHYALLISLSGLSKIIVTSTSGFVAASFGWPVFFIVSAALSIPSLLCIVILARQTSLSRA